MKYFFHIAIGNSICRLLYVLFKDFPISVHPDSAICQSVQYLPAATRPHLKNFDLTIVLPDVLLTPNPLLLPHTRSNHRKMKCRIVYSIVSTNSPMVISVSSSSNISLFNTSTCQIRSSVPTGIPAK